LARRRTIPAFRATWLVDRCSEREILVATRNFVAPEKSVHPRPRHVADEIRPAPRSKLVENADSAGSDLCSACAGAAAFVESKDGRMAKKSSAASKPSRNKPSKRARESKAAAVLQRASVSGWRTSDEDEIGLRRWRGRTEVLDVVALEPDRSFFGDFRTRSANGGGYEVEIRSLDGFTNSCGCIDRTGSEPASTSKACWRRSGAESRGRFARRPHPEARESRFFSIGTARRRRGSPCRRGRTRRDWCRHANGCMNGSKTTQR
jgi:hypothetical protein